MKIRDTWTVNEVTEDLNIVMSHKIDQIHLFADFDTGTRKETERGRERGTPQKERSRAQKEG